MYPKFRFGTTAAYLTCWLKYMQQILFSNFFCIVQDSIGYLWGGKAFYIPPD